MELQLAVRSARSNRRHHPVGDIGVATTTTKAIPGYLKPSSTTGSSCHDDCKYGAGAHAFEDPHQNVDARSSRRAQPPTTTKPRKQHQQPPPTVVAADQQKRSSTSPLIRVRLVPRRLFGGRGSSRGNDEKVVKGAGGNDGKEKKPAAENVEWKDIAAYGTVTAAHDAKAGAEDARQQQAHGVIRSQNGSVDMKVVVNKSVGSSKMTRRSREPAGDRKNNMNTDDDTTKTTVKPPRVKKPSVLLDVAKKKAAVVVDHELVDHGYQPVSPSLLQKRASLLRDLEEEMVHDHESSNVNEFKATYSLDQEEFAAAAAESGRRPVPAHRRVKSMSVSSISSSRSVRFPFITRQASNNSATFKLRSKSSKGAGPIIVLPPEEAKPAPARLRSRRGSVGGGDEIRSTSGRGVQLRIRSLRRRGGVGVGGDARATSSGGFVVPAVSLRHQKTLEKKRSQRLYNNMIEETAGKLVKARKSRVKALVGAFESVISRIAK